MAEDMPTEVLRGTFPTPELAAASTLCDANIPTPEPAVPYPKVPGYDIIGELGRGGMGVVYEAWQRSLNRPVALKMIRATVGVTVSEVARFVIEAEAIAAVRHPNVVQVFECGTHAGFPYIVLEYLPGGTLSRKLSEGQPLEPRTAAELVVAVASGVQAAHEAGIVHRDLKPGNILFSEARKREPGDTRLLSPSTAKVTDFGIARRDDSHLTGTGVALGTPAYMAPEQAAGRSQFVGPAADVYAMGVILFESLTGRTPFEGDGWSVIQQANTQPVPSLRRLSAAVPRDLELICHKCLEKQPHHRYGSAADLADDLRRFLDGKPVVARPLGPVSRTWRAIRRNPVVACLTVAVVLSSAVGGAISLVKANEADRSAQIANEKAVAAKTEEATAKAALTALKEETEARKAADAFALRTVRVALYSRELGDARRALAAGDVSVAERALAACETDIRGWEWQLLDRWLARQSPVLEPTSTQFLPERLAVSPDGRWVAGAGLPMKISGPPVAGSNSVWLWDLKAGGRPIHLVGASVAYVRVLDIDSTTQRVLAMSDDALRVWDIAHPEKPILEEVLGRPRKEPIKRTTHPLTVRLVNDRVLGLFPSAAKGDPLRLLTWSLMGNAKPELSEVNLPGSEDTVIADIASDGKSILLASHNSLRRIDLAGKTLAGPVAFEGTPAEIASAAGSKAAVLWLHGTDKAGVLVAWDGTDTKLGRRFALDEQPQAIDVCSDGRVLIAVESHRRPDSLRLWDPTTGSIEVGPRFDGFRGAAAFADNRRLLIGDFIAGLRVWGSTNLHEQELSVPARFVQTALSGNQMAMVDNTSSKLWVRLSNDGPVVEHIPDPATAYHTGVAWVGQRVALVASSKTQEAQFVLLYDPSAKAILHRWDIPAHHGAVVAGCRNRIAFAVSGIAQPGQRESIAVEVHDATSGNLIRSLALPGDGTFARQVVLSPDGKYVAAIREKPFGTANPQTPRPSMLVSVWDIERGTAIWGAEIRSGVESLAFSADGSLLAACCRDGKVRVWPTVDGKDVREFSVPTGASSSQFGNPHGSIQSLAFSPDGTRLAGAGWDGIAIWDLATGQPVLVIPTPADRVAFSADGRQLQVSAANKLLVYDAGSR